MQPIEIFYIPLTDIKLEGINVRTDMNSSNSQENLNELTESIRINGLMQPIVLKGIKDNPPYDVVVGQRRFLAHEKLGIETIASTFTGIISDTDALVLSLSENLLRQELNHSDIAEAVTKLYNEYQYDVYKVRDKLGLSIKAIRGYVKVEAQATTKIKAMLQTQQISLQDAKRAIDAAQGDNEKADILIDQLSKMTRYEKIRAVEAGKANPKSTVEDILKKATTPKLEETVILNLPFKVAKALKDAANNLAIDNEVIIMNALTDWLKTNDYLI